MDYIELINQLIRKSEGADSFHRMHIRNGYFTYTQSQIGQVSACAFNLSDTLVACASYLGSEHEPDAGLRYLKICGIFQALFIQQDSFNYLRQILLPELGPIDWKKDFPLIAEIREYRNRYFGHPTEGRGTQQFPKHVGAIMPTSSSLKTVSLLRMHTYQGVENAMFTDVVDVFEQILLQLNFLNDHFDEIYRRLQAKYKP